MMLINIGEDKFQEEVLDFSGVVLVDFYADWCGPCRVLSQVLEELSQEDLQTKYVKINVDHNPQISMQFEIHNLPTLLLFKNGEISARNIGSLSKIEIESFIRSHC